MSRSYNLSSLASAWWLRDSFNLLYSCVCRWVFETGRLAPGYDFFRCVVNIPEDVERVGEPAEGMEQMAVMKSATRQYGAATMVGKDEMNGRINPALEPDDDMDMAEVEKIRGVRQRGSVGAGPGGGGSRGNTSTGIPMTENSNSPKLGQTSL
jgi:high affinity choline transporter 7